MKKRITMKKITLLILFFTFALCGNGWADTFKGAPQQGADDGDETLDNGGTVDTLNPDVCIELMRVSILRWGGAMRFPNVTIPQGSTIDSAYMKVYNASGFQRACDTIACQNVDSATVLEGGAGTYDISERWVNVTTKVYWNEWMSQWSNTPDTIYNLKIPLQDIVNREGWKSGNAVLFLFKTILASACTAKYEPFSYEVGARRETLFVDYTISGVNKNKERRIRNLLGIGE